MGGGSSNTHYNTETPMANSKPRAMQYILRSYQKMASDAAVRAFKSKKKGNGLLILPTGAGKSLVIADIASKIDGPLLVFQPSKEILEQIDRELTINLEPRKKGKWDFMGWQMFQCSECKHMFTQDFLEGWKEYTYESHFPPFCPNCGADMREGEEE